MCAVSAERGMRRCIGGKPGPPRNHVHDPQVDHFVVAVAAGPPAVQCLMLPWMPRAALLFPAVWVCIPAVQQPSAGRLALSTAHYGGALPRHAAPQATWLQRWPAGEWAGSERGEPQATAAQRHWPLTACPLGGRSPQSPWSGIGGSLKCLCFNLMNALGPALGSRHQPPPPHCANRLPPLQTAPALLRRWQPAT